MIVGHFLAFFEDNKVPPLGPFPIGAFNSDFRYWFCVPCPYCPILPNSFWSLFPFSIHCPHDLGSGAPPLTLLFNTDLRDQLNPFSLCCSLHSPKEAGVHLTLWAYFSGFGVPFSAFVASFTGAQTIWIFVSPRRRCLCSTFWHAPMQRSTPSFCLGTPTVFYADAALPF